MKEVILPVLLAAAGLAIYLWPPGNLSTWAGLTGMLIGLSWLALLVWRT